MYSSIPVAAAMSRASNKPLPPLLAGATNRGGSGDSGLAASLLLLAGCPPYDDVLTGGSNTALLCLTSCNQATVQGGCAMPLQPEAVIQIAISRQHLYAPDACMQSDSHQDERDYWKDTQAVQSKCCWGQCVVFELQQSEVVQGLMLVCKRQCNMSHN